MIGVDYYINNNYTKYLAQTVRPIVYILRPLTKLLLSALVKKIYRCTSTFSALKYTAVEFYSNLSAIYTKSCAQTFPPISGLFAIFDSNFAEIVAPPGNKNGDSVVRLKGQSLPKLEMKSITSKAMQYRQDIVTLICSLHEWYGMV